MKLGALTRRLCGALALAFVCVTAAHAQSTINTGQPSSNSNLSSLVVRQLAQDAASDINGILGMHAVASLSDCLSTTYTGVDCLVTGTSPYLWYKWSGTSWGLVGSLNPTTGAIGVALSSLNLLQTYPISLSFNTGVATIALDYNSTLAVSGNNLGINLSNPNVWSNQTFVAPVLGAATATSINGLGIDATTGTLDIANGQTLTDTSAISGSSILIPNGAGGFSPYGGTSNVGHVLTGLNAAGAGSFMPYGLTGNSTLVETTTSGLLTSSLLPFGTATNDVCEGGIVTAAGPVGSATTVPIVTYNGCGQITGVTTATITPAVGSITGFGTGVATALADSVGAVGSVVVNGGALGTPSSGTLGSGVTIQISNTTLTGTLGGTNGGIGIASPAAHSLVVTEGASAANLLTAATAGRIPIDQGSGIDPAFEAIGGDATLASNGALTVTKTNGTAFGALATATPGTNVAAAVAQALNASGGLLGLVPTRTGDFVYWNGSSWASFAGNNSGTQYFSENASGSPAWGTPTGAGDVSGPGSSTNGDLSSFNGTTGQTLQDSGINSSNVDTLSGNQTITGVKQYTADQYFGSGRPWVDVKSGANSCAAAAGNGSADDTAAIQCQINYMATTFSGGIVYLPPGIYDILTSGGLTIKSGVELIGSGQNSTFLRVTSNLTVVSWDSSCIRGTSLQSLTVYGYINASASAYAVTIYNSCPVIIRDATIWGGSFALNNAGVDSLIENAFLCGTASGGGAVNSTGANWYVRVKMDSCGYATIVAFQQDAYEAGSGVAENHFVQCDFSGSYNYSVFINDGNNESITVIDGSVFSSPIDIVQGKATILTGDEIGSTSLTLGASGGSLIVTGSYAFSATTLSLPGGSTNFSCAGNVQLTC